MTGHCLDCDVPVSKSTVLRCRYCNGRLMSRRHRMKRGQRAARLAVQSGIEAVGYEVGWGGPRGRRRN